MTTLWAACLTVTLALMALVVLVFGGMIAYDWIRGL